MYPASRESAVFGGQAMMRSDLKKEDLEALAAYLHQLR